MAESPDFESIRLATPIGVDYYPDPPREPYVEVTGAELALICGDEGPAGPCLTCQWAEGMCAKVNMSGLVDAAPIEAMKCRRGQLLVLVLGAGIRYGCSRWERAPGAEG